MKHEFVAHTLVRTLRQEPDLPLFLGLMVSNPASIVEGDSVAINEVSIKPYVRQQVKLAVDERDHRFLLNAERIFFTKPEKKYGFMTHIAIFDAQQPSDDDNLLLLKSIGYVLPLEAGNPIVFDKHELRIFIGDINPGIL